MSKITALLTIIVTMTCAGLCTGADDAALKKIASYENLHSYSNKMISHASDLADIAKGIHGLDQEIALKLAKTPERCSVALEHVHDVLVIEAVVQNQDDKERIKPFISLHIKHATEDVELLTRQLNETIGYLTNQAVTATAVKVRDDLHAIKELLLKLQSERK
jgi:hypothetical protein